MYNDYFIKYDDNSQKTQEETGQIYILNVARLI